MGALSYSMIGLQSLLGVSSGVPPPTESTIQRTLNKWSSSVATSRDCRFRCRDDSLEVRAKHTGWRFFLFIAICLSVAADCRAGTDEVVKIGFAAPLTGPLAQYGKATEAGARLAIAELNATPVRVDGHRVQLVLESRDDAGDPRTATLVAQSLVDDHVVAVIGHMTSGTSVPASRIYSHAAIAQLSPGATSPSYTHQGFATTFRLVATDASQGAALAKYAAHALHVRSVVLVDDQSEYGKSLASAFEQTALETGITVFRHDAVSAYAFDFRALLTILKSADPDAILFSGYINTGVLFARQAHQLGLHAMLLGGDGLCDDTLANLVGSGADRLICSTAGADYRYSERGEAFERKFTKYFGTGSSGFAPNAYDAVHLIADAMARANSIHAARILQTLSTETLDGATGRISFDRYGDLRNQIITIYRYRAGRRDAVFVDTGSK
jgi:branched-chain amino acid transport system substrate-binding protein